MNGLLASIGIVGGYACLIVSAPVAAGACFLVAIIGLARIRANQVDSGD